MDAECVGAVVRAVGSGGGVGMKCPKCGRDTYSKKWERCTGCGYGESSFKSEAKRRRVQAGQPLSPPEDVTHVTGRRATPITHVTTKPPIVARGVTPVMGRAELVTSVIGPGEECPTCHRKMPSKNAMKQAAYRQTRLGRGRKA